MLSKISVLMLGLVAERPLNPYEITKLLDQLHVRDWFPIASSSVYAALKALEQKDLITGEVRREGNMPEKTVYSVTEQGREEFLAALRAFLAGTEPDPNLFNIAGIFLCHLGQGEVLTILKRKDQWLARAHAGITNQLDFLEKSGRVPALGLTVVRHNMYLIEAERNTVRQLIEVVEADTGWDHFIARDLQDEKGREY